MPDATNDYTQALLTQRAKRAEQLLADRGWLTLAGLFWLHEGINTLGADPNNHVVLAGATLPAQAGTLELEKESLLLRAATGVSLLHNGVAVQELSMRHDLTEQPDYVTLGTLTMLVIKRGTRYAIRLFDTANPACHTFPGLCWYAINPALAIVADYVPHPSPRTLAIATALGDITPSVNPGAVYFTLDGHACVLEAEDRGSKFFFNFRDLTNGETTYPAGRFLYTDVPVNGKVTLDFNQATNPYCAYTPYATCPLPPPQNRLPVRVEAGERRYTG